LTKKMYDNRHDAMKMVRSSLFLLGGLGLLFGLILFLGAPLLVHVVLGDAFHGSVAALRVFSLWIPLVALSTVMTFQLLLPNQMDYQFNFVILTAGLLSFGSALLLAPTFQAVGIAWSAVLAQLYTLVAFSVVLARAGLNPFAFSHRRAVVTVSG
jgi:O-antigen/teichoic acid export membrane protein